MLAEQPNRMGPKDLTALPPPRRSAPGAGLKIVATVSALLVCGSAVFLNVRFGSLAAGWAYLQGYAVWAEPVQGDIGAIQPGIEAKQTFRLQNLTSRPVTVIGSRVCSGCSVNRELPLTIPPHGERKLPVTILTHSDESPFEREIELFLDVPATKPVLAVRARVLQANDLSGFTDP